MNTDEESVWGCAGDAWMWSRSQLDAGALVVTNGTA